MRFAAIADVHGNLAALEAVVEDLGRRGVADVVNLGDLASGPLFPSETIDRLMQLAWPTIKGNHERQVLAPEREQMGLSDSYAAAALSAAQRAWIERLPSSLMLWDEALLVHGTPESDVGYFLETVTNTGLRAATMAEVVERAHGVEARLTLCGHTHLPRQVMLGDGRLIVNPGSVGLPAYEDDWPYPHRVETASPRARYAVLERGPSGWRAELIAVDYDWEQAARDAIAHGRPDWARALRTGKV